MPPRIQQTYGKRSRATYDPFAIFASPQRPDARKTPDDVEVNVLADQVEELKLYQKARDARWRGGDRVALGERSPNAAAAKKEHEGREKGRRPRRKKVLLDEDTVEPTQDQETTEALQQDEVVVEKVETDISGSKIFDEATAAVDCELEDPLTSEPAAQAIAKPEPQNHEERKRDLQEPHADPSATASPQRDPPDVQDVYTTHTAALLSLSSHSLTSFPEWSNQLTNHFNLTKIAEASFGEVYRLSLLNHLPGFSPTDESVFKVIALKPPSSTLPKAKKDRQRILKKAEAMSHPDDVANEVRLLQRMTSIPGFTNFRDVRILQGRPGQPFLQAFKAYNIAQKARGKDLSIFPDPSKKSSYAADQLWAVIEMQDAGTDLERLVESGACTSVWAVWDVFWQVVLTLAKGEEGAEFEHRDLHLGNICVRSTPHASSHASATASKQQNATTNPQIDTQKTLGFTDFETTLIDYTISRCLLSTPMSSTNPTNLSAPEIAYHDLSSDPSLFQGDSAEEYQYDIYRYMRGLALHSDCYWEPQPETDNLPIHEPSPSHSSWQSYHPSTNLVWLHYLLHQLLEQLSWPSATPRPNLRKKKGSKKSDEFATWKKANDLEHRLLRLQTLLEPEKLGTGVLGSAAGLVALGLMEGWLGEGDVVGAGGSGGRGEEGEDPGEGELGEVPVLGNEEKGGGKAMLPSSEGLEASSSFTHLVVDVGVMEERGLEGAVREARAGRRRGRRGVESSKEQEG
ncbi:hypothetical protein B0A50_06262 [Salinomyces thailandicus]|uniref:non-specific serine/threonine protein kinase n=1 Tax=Salinomyces thailandicus TaxID=706561 RepID=A0A4U0TT54_9PEZI|nr:hypothetical protein B0A50_06262 [Salinomyces thailandica]